MVENLVLCGSVLARFGSCGSGFPVRGSVPRPSCEILVALRAVSLRDQPHVLAGQDFYSGEAHGHLPEGLPGEAEGAGARASQVKEGQWRTVETLRGFGLRCSMQCWPR